MNYAKSVVDYKRTVFSILSLFAQILPFSFHLIS